ncbi:hypothetical protein ACQKQD_16035 [Methylobacterium sp. NPDC080182]|uniref:hypothetical protein n=1 Tax=Methylobacterium sp. NPDC080182 TaxID=3390590 RepID=UPI003D0859D3
MTEPWKDRIFTNAGPLPLRSENPDDGYTVEDLVPHGWAPGEYVGPCRECSEVFVAAKRSRRCRPCAVKSLEAYRNRPTWQSGHKGIPTDRPVWAYFFDSGGEDEHVTLLRGVSEVDGEVFSAECNPDGDEWPRFGHVVCWIDFEERPSLSVEAVDAIVVALSEAGIHWSCGDHIVEDWLHREALRAVVDGHRDAPAIAAAALKSRELKFSRYYG